MLTSETADFLVELFDVVEVAAPLFRSAKRDFFGTVSQLFDAATGVFAVLVRQVVEVGQQQKVFKLDSIRRGLREARQPVRKSVHESASWTVASVSEQNSLANSLETSVRNLSTQN